LEGINALRNYTKVKEQAQTLTLSNVDRVCDFTLKNRGNPTIEPVALQTLKNCQRIPEFEQKIRGKGI